ncbi:MAG TPA: DUF1028 domain-containing protein [Syntrophomonadaceae bacterium]|nr:DUF1028 domain-containing protein [Syntrophomonadaceae bacterium]
MRHTLENVVATFSIVARDPETGELGVAVQSKFLAVGAVVPWARGGVGAIATQSWANTSFGPKGLQMLEDGLSAQETLERLLAEDEGREYRQVGIVDSRGGSATFTGKECFPWAGGVSGPNYACQGNILVNKETVTEMERVFLESKGDLATRLLLALDAAGEAGGDSRGKQSAAILVVKCGGGYGGFNDRYVDLRVDDHPDPIKELIRLHKLYRLYFYKTDPSRLVKVEGDVMLEIIAALTKLGYYSGQPVSDWSPELQDALMRYYLTENFDERIAEEGYIDGEVLDFMRKQVRD